MWYLFMQIWVWLIIAFALGALTHWLFCCRGKEQENKLQSPRSGDGSKNHMDTSDSALSTSASLVASDAQTAVSDSWKPQGYTEAPSVVDDLKRIKGVGLVIESTLNGLGIYQFQQIAAWSDDNVAWVEDFIAFPGRIFREDWINQARTLHDGGTTDFANRVDKGDVDY